MNLQPKSIFILGVCLAFFMGWNYYISKKYPNYNKPAPNISTEATPPKMSAGETISNSPAAAKDVIEVTPEKFLEVKNENMSFLISSRGMGIKNLVLNKFTDKESKNIKLGDSDQILLFEFRLAGVSSPIYFDIKAVEEGTYVGTAKIGNTVIQRKYVVDAKSYSLKSEIFILKPTEDLLKGLTVLIPEKIFVHPSTSWLFPSYEHQDFYVESKEKVEAVNFSAAKEDLKREYATTQMVALGSQYFATALLDQSEIMPEIHLNSKHLEKSALAEVIYKPASIQSDLTLKQILFAGPKSIDILKSADAQLAGIINFGMLGFIARPMLYLMKLFFEFMSNWGVAIIFLTLVVRLLVLPFNLMSAKSMKAMQKIQPLMTAVREKHKDDPMRLNQEIMSLMKEHKANPLGGCLPMLLQIPIFFALYRVISSSVELYQSPFYGWIHDLSQHDPFYIFPVLMGVTMFVQQKMTPTNMDPTQAKIMAFLPLIFTVFMLQLPSGLTLYMFVSAIFGIAQQWWMLRDRQIVQKI